MSTRFYSGQKDYIVQLNLMDDEFDAAVASVTGKANKIGDTFTGEILLSWGAPALVFNNTAQAAGSRRWGIALAGSELAIQTRTDDNGVSTTPFKINRNGTVTLTNGLSAASVSTTGNANIGGDVMANTAVAVNSVIAWNGTDGQISVGGDANGSVELGKTGRTTAGTPYIDFHSAANSSDYDVRLMASGGTSANSGKGTLEITAENTNTSGNVGVGGNLTVTGNLTVNGETSIQATNVTIDDPVITMGTSTSDNNKDRGVEFKWHNGVAAKTGFFGFDDSTGKWTFIPDATNASDVFSGTKGTLVANLEGDVTGNVTGNVTGAVTGNASTATTLQTARTINGVSFNGSANITVADSTKLPLTGGTLTGELTFQDDGEGVTFSGGGRFYKKSGTGLVIRRHSGDVDPQVENNAGTTSWTVLHAGNFNTWAPTLTGTGASGTWNIGVSGNAATATALETARTINGTSFNGSANITTTNWGTARTLTVGNTDKSVNGSANVSWSLSEIGALPTAGGTMTGTLTMQAGVAFDSSAAERTVQWNTGPVQAGFYGNATNGGTFGMYDWTNARGIWYYNVTNNALAFDRASTFYNGITTTDLTATGIVTLAQNTKIAAAGGQEGGQLLLAKPATNTTMAGDLAIDSAMDQIRIFENGGTLRGYTFDMAAATEAAGTRVIGHNIDNTFTATNTFNGKVNLTYTSGLRLPVGTTAQRPTAAAGEVRLNSETAQFEGYNGTTWDALGANLSTLNTGSKNKVINGSMQIAQRPTSTNVPLSGTVFAADRMRFSGNVGASFTIGQGTSVPPNGEFQYNSYITVGTAIPSSVSATAYALLSHRMEGYLVRDLVGKTFTASFWVRSPRTGVHSLAFHNGADNMSYLATYTINVADAWEFKTVTVAGGIPNTGTWNFDSQEGMGIHWPLAMGSDFTTATTGSWIAGNYLMASGGSKNLLDVVGGVFAVTGIQLEVGSIATPFEHRPIPLEIAMCQRYYEVMYAHSYGYAPAGGAASAVAQPKVSKRATPTVTQAVAATESNFTYSGIAVDASSNAVAYGYATASGTFEIQRYIYMSAEY